MKISFKQDDSLSDDEIKVTVSANQLSAEVTNLLNKLTKLSSRQSVLPISVNEKVIMVPIKHIIAVEVYGDHLSIYVPNKDYQIRGQLKTLLDKLEPHGFIRVSRSAVVNLDHLMVLEPAFSGNMTARMSDDHKFSVSRKYLPDLKRKLGL